MDMVACVCVCVCVCAGVGTTAPFDGWPDVVSVTTTALVLIAVAILTLALVSEGVAVGLGCDDCETTPLAPGCTASLAKHSAGAAGKEYRVVRSVNPSCF